MVLSTNVRDHLSTLHCPSSGVLELSSQQLRSEMQNVTEYSEGTTIIFEVLDKNNTKDYESYLFYFSRFSFLGFRTRSGNRRKTPQHFSLIDYSQVPKAVILIFKQTCYIGFEKRQQLFSIGLEKMLFSLFFNFFLQQLSAKTKIQ